MEFRFRAGDVRSGPPPRSTDAAATSADSMSAATHVQDSYGGHSTGYHGENTEPVPPPASDLDELWRQAAKARIRERILREEAEKLAELEAEVRRELVQERIPLLRSGLGRSVGACAALGSVPAPPPSGTHTWIDLEARSNENAPVALPVKRNKTDVAAASAASISTSSNKQKLDLSCTVCGIPATSEKALQDHLRGKVHMRKAARLAQPMDEVGPGDDDEAMQVQSKANVLAVLPHKQENPSVLTVTTSSETKKPDLTCKVCGITLTSQKAMQDHLAGKTHKRRKVAKLPQPMPEEEVITNMVPSKENASILWAAANVKKHNLDLTCTGCAIPVTSEKAMEDHLKGKAHWKKAAALVPEEAEHVQEEKEEENRYSPKKIPIKTKIGTIYEVMQMNGSVFCEVCNVRTADVITMICHVQGTKHTSKARQKAIDAAIVDGDPQTLAMTVKGVPHTVRRVGGSLLCELCHVKVPLASEGVMRSHLSGKIHTNKMKAVPTAVDMGAVVGQAEIMTKDVASSTNVHIRETPVQDDNGSDTIDGSKLVEHKADTEGNSSHMREMEAIKTDGIAVVPADQEVKYQVEGKLFIVLRRPDGRLSCRLCGVHGHGSGKYDMIKHLYAHLDNVRVAKKRSR